MQQLSAEWFQARCGFVTGSHASDILDFTARGLPGAKRKTYMRTKLGELLTGMAMQPGFVSPEMLTGIEREPAARSAYELQEKLMVEEVGFLKHPSLPRCGGSCDGLVGDEGIIEIKCGKVGTHLQWILDSKVPDKHIPQIDFYLAVSGRAWCDFVAFNPEVPKPLQLMVVRHDRIDSSIRSIETHVASFNAEIDRLIERLRAIVGPFDLPAAEAVKFHRPGDGFTEDEDEMLGITDEEIRSVDPSWKGEES